MAHVFLLLLNILGNSLYKLQETREHDTRNEMCIPKKSEELQIHRWKFERSVNKINKKIQKFVMDPKKRGTIV